MSEVPLGAFRDLVGIRRDRLDRLFADDDVVPLKEHYAGSDLVPFRVDQRLRAAQVVEAGDDRKRGSQVDADGGMFAFSHGGTERRRRIEGRTEAEEHCEFVSSTLTRMGRKVQCCDYQEEARFINL